MVVVVVMVVKMVRYEGHSHYIHTAGAIMYTHPTSVCCSVWAQNAPLLRRSSSDILHDCTVALDEEYPAR